MRKLSLETEIKELQSNYNILKHSHADDERTRLFLETQKKRMIKKIVRLQKELINSLLVWRN